MVRKGFDLIAVEEIPFSTSTKYPRIPLSRTLFVHAGINLETVKAYASSTDPKSSESPIDTIRAECKHHLLHDPSLQSSHVLEQLVWTRHLAEGSDQQACPEVDEILKLAKAERVVLGHTPTFYLAGGQVGVPMVRCGGRLLLSDVGMSWWMGGSGRGAALDRQRLTSSYFRAAPAHHSSTPRME